MESCRPRAQKRGFSFDMKRKWRKVIYPAVTTFYYPNSFLSPFFFFFSAFSSVGLSVLAEDVGPVLPLRMLKLLRLKCELEFGICGKSEEGFRDGGGDGGTYGAITGLLGSTGSRKRPVSSTNLVGRSTSVVPG